jgi:hypothetical protein
MAANQRAAGAAARAADWMQALPGCIAAVSQTLAVFAAGAAADGWATDTSTVWFKWLAVAATAAFLLALANVALAPAAARGHAGAPAAAPLALAAAAAAAHLGLLYRTFPPVQANGVDAKPGAANSFCNWCDTPAAMAGLVVATFFAAATWLAAAPAQARAAKQWPPAAAAGAEQPPAEPATTKQWQLLHLATVLAQAAAAAALLRTLESPSCYDGTLNGGAANHCGSEDGLPQVWAQCGQALPDSQGWLAAVRATLLHARAALNDVLFLYCLPAGVVGLTLCCARSHPALPPTLLLLLLAVYAALHTAKAAAVLHHLAADYDDGQCQALVDKLRDAAMLAALAALAAVASAGAAATAL